MRGLLSNMSAKELKKISTELNRVQNLILRIRGNIYKKREHKDDLEWWILGRVSQLLKQKGLHSPHFAEKAMPPEADFITYGKDRKYFRPIEITEVLPPGRKRSQEYTEATGRIRRIEKKETGIELWESLKGRIKKKLLRKYEENSWLLIYFNILYMNISMYGHWDRAISNQVASWLEAGDIDFSNGNYERVYVIDSAGNALVCIHPEIEVIVPESTNLGSDQ